MKIGFVVAEFNKEITSKMLEIAKQHAKENNIEIGDTIFVSGAFDMPLAIKKILESDVDGVVTLGAVIQGETSHDEVIVHSLAKTIMELSLQYNKPIGFGVSGPRITRQQAIERIEAYAKRSVDAVVKLKQQIN